MTVHLCRDYVTVSSTTVNSGNSPIAPMYVMLAFMRRVLGYTIIGQTNLNLDGAAITISDLSSLTATVNADGTVTIPSGLRTVSTGDINRMLVLKSTSNPTVNSGCFRITGANTGPNSYTIDRRTSDAAVAESGLSWWLFESDAVVTALWNSNGNGSGSSYAGNGAATCSRIILQSPHSTGWQVRCCVEPIFVYSDPSILCSVAPGFGGNSSGDFPVGSPSLHGGLFFNNAPGDLTHIGCTVGLGPTVSQQNRVTIVGDDTGQSIFAFQRVSSGAGNNNYVAFGIPDNEPLPLPPQNINRLFVLGAAASWNNGGYMAANFLQSNGAISGGGKEGVAFGLNGSIVSCSPSLWTYITSPSGQGQSPIYDSNAADINLFDNTQFTALLPVDLVVGVFKNRYYSGFTDALKQEPRTIGTIPFVRAGRVNFGNFSNTTDASKAWQHMVNGVYLTWNGPSVTP